MPRAIKELQPLHPMVPGALESPGGWKGLGPPSVHSASSEGGWQARLGDRLEEAQRPTRSAAAGILPAGEGSLG